MRLKGHAEKGTREKQIREKMMNGEKSMSEGVNLIKINATHSKDVNRDWIKDE